MKTKQTLHLTDATFNEEVLQSDRPVLVDFWAPWCGPCKALGPTIDELAEDQEGRAKVGKLNVDENPETSRQYAISSIPTVLVFHNGKIVETIVGLKGKKDFTAVLDKLISA